MTRAVNRADGAYFNCELPDGTISSMPSWMFDPAACGEHSLGLPEVSISALRDLRQLLDALHPTADGTEHVQTVRSVEGMHEQSKQVDR